MCRSKDFRIDKKVIQESEHYAILAFLLALLCGSLTVINSTLNSPRIFRLRVFHVDNIIDTGNAEQRLRKCHRIKRNGVYLLITF